MDEGEENRKDTPREAPTGAVRRERERSKDCGRMKRENE